MNSNREESNIVTFLQGVEVPDIVEEKAQEAFRQIRRKGQHPVNERESREGRSHARGAVVRGFVLSRAAVIIGVCFLVFGTTAAAIGIGSLYRQRMENMNAESVENYYELACKEDITSYNRMFTEEESLRYQQLKEDYEKNGRFPESQIAVLKEGEIYAGEGIFLDESTITLYLPEEPLGDEELLELIDFEHKMNYSIYAKQQDRILQGGTWESRMLEMTDEMVDRIYYITFSTRNDVSGGYNRELTKEEEQRYERLVKEYEDGGKYVDMEMTVIDIPEEYTGEGIAICVEDADYYLPAQELTDGELLQIIDMEHKKLYCLQRISDEIQMGFRSGYPARAYDDETENNMTGTWTEEWVDEDGITHYYTNTEGVWSEEWVDKDGVVHRTWQDEKGHLHKTTSPPEEN